MPALLGAASLIGAANADDNPVILQWFETRWVSMERRAPDVFMAGYSGVWIPPPSRASDGNSPGYDVFDRFDLGRPGAPTLYGTEAELRALIAELHQAGVQVYADSVLNHNSARTSNEAFIADGGWPGFVMNRAGDFWGDFHEGNRQSENPNGSNYDLWTGDLLGLIDIAQEENIQVIRHPVTEGDSANIPAGLIRNRADAGNRRFYPDLGLTARQFINPATGHSWTVHPFNLADATAGDAVAENATGLLLRWTGWMLEDVGVDGFRLDAAKHIPQWFWNDLWDSAVFQRRIAESGQRTTPFSFGEVIADNGFAQTYVRKDGFGNRDVLDINGAGALRSILLARGVGSWNAVLQGSIDGHDNGAHDGSQGVGHVYSHDNGSTDGVPPAEPSTALAALPEFAFALLKPGVSIVYHNGREMAGQFGSRGFWPDEGSPTALGNGDQFLRRIVQIGNGHARGELAVLNVTDPINQSTDDVLVFERRTRREDGTFIGNLLVGVNDRYDGGVQIRSVQTSFAPGTRLHELTGNAADPQVDSANQIDEVLVVDAQSRILLAVPNNRNTLAVEHHRGYVAYGPASPSGVLTIVGATSVLPADDASTPTFRRRLTAVPVVTGEAFTIRLQTTKTDPIDPSWDDNAVFRVDAGYRDLNGNGVVDVGASNPTVGGHEQFLTTHRSIMSDPSQNGLYEQTISAAALGEGLHYVSAVAFRHRTDGGEPILTEFRSVLLIDRAGPEMALIQPVAVSGSNHEFRVRALDRTANSVHVLVDAPAGVDPRTLVADSNRAARFDRQEWRRAVSGLATGAHRVTIVAFEETGNSSVQEVDVEVTIGNGDVNGDLRRTIDDLYDLHRTAAYVAEGDMNRDGVLSVLDQRILEGQLRQGETSRMAFPQR